MDVCVFRYVYVHIHVYSIEFIHGQYMYYAVVSLAYLWQIPV